MRLERTTISGRRLTAALTALLVVCGGLTGLAALRARAQPQPVPVAADPTPAATGNPGVPAPASPRPLPTEPAATAAPLPSAALHTAAPADNGDAAATEPPRIVADEPGPAPQEPPAVGAEQPPSEWEIIEAKQVAADFAVGLGTYRYDDEPDALLERVEPYVTADLAERLGANSGGQAGREELAAREEVATALVETVQSDTVQGGAMDLLVVLRQDVTTRDGTQTRYPSYLVRMVRTGEGWRVAGFQQ